MTRHYPYFLFSGLLAVFLLVAVLPAAVAAPLIEQIEFDASGANVDRITFKLNSATLPKTFALKAPPRAVFDFPDTALARGVKTNIPASGKFIKGIRSAEHRGDKAKTRVVLDLIAEQAVDFKQDFDAATNTLVISVFAQGSEPAPAAVAPPPAKPEAAAPVAAKKPVPPPAAEPAPAAKPEPAAEKVAAPAPQAQEPAKAAPPKPEPGIAPTEEEATVIQPLSEIGQEKTAKEGGEQPILHSIAFDKNGNKGETVNFMLNTFNPPVVFGIEEDSPRIICFFKDTAAGPQLQDAIEAKGRFVKNIQVGKYNNPDNIRVVMDLVPHHNYDLQQIFFKEDNMFMIIINTTGQ